MQQSEIIKGLLRDYIGSGGDPNDIEAAAAFCEQHKPAGCGLINPVIAQAILRLMGYRPVPPASYIKPMTPEAPPPPVVVIENAPTPIVIAAETVKLPEVMPAEPVAVYNEVPALEPIPLGEPPLPPMPAQRAPVKPNPVEPAKTQVVAERPWWKFWKK